MTKTIVWMSNEISLAAPLIFLLLLWQNYSFLIMVHGNHYLTNRNQRLPVPTAAPGQVLNKLQAIAQQSGPQGQPAKH